MAFITKLTKILNMSNKYTNPVILESMHSKCCFHSKQSSWHRSELVRIQCSNYIFKFQPFHLHPNYQKLDFHCTPRSNVPPIIWLVIKPLAKLVSIVSGRSVRKWWRSLPKDKQVELKQKVKLPYLFIFAGLLGLGFSIHYITHLEETPITKRKRFVAFTEEQFVKIVQFEVSAILAEAGDKLLPPDDPHYQAIVNICTKIVQSNQDIDFFRKQNWTVAVINSDIKNAFVTPTGNIFVFTGLFKAFTNTDQLAVVLGHEMAHALLRHGAEQVSFAQYLDYFIILAMAALWAFVPSDGIAVITTWFYQKVIDILFHLPYSRKLEIEADEVGLMLIAKACFDVRQSSVFWQLMAMQNQVDAESQQIAFLSTHPTHESRAENLDELIPSALEIRTRCNCPTLPVADPRITAREQFNALIASAVGKSSNVINLPTISPPLPHSAQVITGNQTNVIRGGNQAIVNSGGNQTNVIDSGNLTKVIGGTVASAAILPTDR